MKALERGWVVAAEAYVGFPLHYAVLKGSRLFGINEPMSDVDLVVVFQHPTAAVLGLDKPPHTIRATFMVDSPNGEVELDLKAYELERFLHHMLSHNGNFVEGLCAPEGYWQGSESVGIPLREIGARYKTQRLHPFYRGYAFGQLQRASKQIKTAKGLTYVYRECFAGLVLMRTGQIVYSFPDLARRAQDLLGWQSAVLPRLANTRADVDQRTIERAWEEFTFLQKALDDSLAISPLPETYDGEAEMNRLLLRARLFDPEWDN